VKQDRLIRRIDVRDRNGRVVGTRDVVTYQGLLSKAHDEGLTLVKTTLVQIPTDENARTAIVRSEVTTGKGTFEAIGDANPENVNSFIVPHLIRMAETRAKARALRDAVNVGVISREELDGDDSVTDGFDPGSGRTQNSPAPQHASPPAGNGAALMTEAQRRYLFRILAGQGLQGDVAHDRLKELFDVPSLSVVTKSEATSVIDRLLNEASQEASIHGTA
jgi:hypothetical protein